MNENQWEDLFERHLCGELNESEQEQLCRLLDSDSAARKAFVDQAQLETQIAEVISSESKSPQPSIPTIETTNSNGQLWSGITKAIFAIAALALVAIAIQSFSSPNRVSGSTPQIATITASSGPIQWTGNGGRVFRNLEVGSKLSGGTIDALAPESWFELKFNDGSQIAISGNSMLTFSDYGQKELHLKGGSFSASVEPQPAGKPMLIHTRSAILEVLGTKFTVDAELASTSLNVSEGKVKVNRLSVGDSIVVPALHRVTAAADLDLALERVPDSVHQWKSQLVRGPKRVYGDWKPKTENSDASLKAIPYTLENGYTIYTSAMDVSPGDKPPVVLKPESKIRVRGFVETEKDIYFGLTLRNSNGDFGGNFQTIRPKTDFKPGQEFEVILDLADYRLDPSLEKIKQDLPDSPFGSIVSTMWCHSLFDQAGLAIIEIELIPPTKENNN